MNNQAPGDVTLLNVQGMTCAACQIHVQKSAGGRSRRRLRQRQPHGAHRPNHYRLFRRRQHPHHRRPQLRLQRLPPQRRPGRSRKHGHDGYGRRPPRSPHPPRPLRRRHRDAALHAADDGLRCQHRPTPPRARLLPCPTHAVGAHGPPGPAHPLDSLRARPRHHALCRPGDLHRCLASRAPPHHQHEHPDRARNSSRLRLFLRRNDRARDLHPPRPCL